MHDISEAIPNFTGSGKLQKLENDAFPPDCSSDTLSNDQTLGLGPFSGLLYVTARIATFAFLIRLLEKHLRVSSSIRSTLVNERIWRLAMILVAQRIRKSGHPSTNENLLQKQITKLRCQMQSIFKRG